MEGLEGLGTMMLFVFGGLCLIGLGVLAAICWFLSSCLQRIPLEHRKQEPGMVWLLFIPFFNLVWNFFVYPRIADSFDSYFKSRGESVDCGKSLATTYCVMAACGLVAGFIPFLGLLYPLAVLVILIILLVKFNDLKGRMPPV